MGQPWDPQAEGGLVDPEESKVDVHIPVAIFFQKKALLNNVERLRWVFGLSSSLAIFCSSSPQDFS